MSAPRDIPDFSDGEEETPVRPAEDESEKSTAKKRQIDQKWHQSVQELVNMIGEVVAMEGNLEFMQRQVSQVRTKLAEALDLFI